ncbi:MAG: WYL domain-containing protein [Streptomyces sp.]|jgi:predicted DNA-binding transcriptional regulator YafY|nr:WYL domain-containing protein [Streptomyces sp.]
MRASRLVSLLLLLQNRGRMTAAQLAEELEVSVRTVYRDVESLHAAGIPLYGEAGHSGGYRLLEGYRTRLTGLTSAEAEALALSGLPGAAAELGLGSVLAAAQLKLQAALPAELRAQAGRIRERFHLDAPGWYREADKAPFLPAVATAVWDRRAIRVRYRRWYTPQEVERRLEPSGIVLKAGSWYTVARTEDRVRTYRISQIQSLHPLADGFTPPPDFDLAEHWKSHLTDIQDRLWQGEAEIRISPRGIADLPDIAVPAVVTAVSQGHQDPDGWTRATVPIESLTHARREFLKLGAEVEVLAPTELRDQLIATARGLAAIYD